MGEQHTDRLPGWLRLTFDSATERFSGNAVLLGGSPLRILRLRPKAQALVSELASGATLDSAADAAAVSPAAANGVARRLLAAGMAHPRWNVVAPHLAVADVTVVIPVHNRADSLRELLVALVGSDVSPADCPARVVVVDDGSTDGSGDVARALGATVVRHETPRGPAAARNAGLVWVDTRLVAFIDSDCVPDAGWLGPLVAHFDDPEVVIAAPRITGPIAAERLAGSSRTKLPHHLAGSSRTKLRTAVPAFRPGRTNQRQTSESFRPGRTNQPPRENIRTASSQVKGGKCAPTRSAVGRYEAARSPLDLGPAEGPIAPRTRISYVPAAALVARVDSLRAVGGFSDDMPVGEDVDLLWRLHERGGVLRYEPKATVHHAHRERLGEFLRRRADYGSSAAPLALRHAGMVPPLAISKWSLASWVALASFTRRGLFGGLAAAGVSALLLRRSLGSMPHPYRSAVRLVTRGHLRAGEQCASALWRAWLPAVIPAAVVSQRVRRTMFLSAVVPALAQWLTRRPELDPARWTALRIADDTAYCLGVWRGCVSHRTLGPLLPDLLGDTDHHQTARHQAARHQPPSAPESPHETGTHKTMMR